MIEYATAEKRCIAHGGIIYATDLDYVIVDDGIYCGQCLDQQYGRLPMQLTSSDVFIVPASYCKQCMKQLTVAIVRDDEHVATMIKLLHPISSCSFSKQEVKEPVVDLDQWVKRKK